MQIVFLLPDLFVELCFLDVNYFYSCPDSVGFIKLEDKMRSKFFKQGKLMTGDIFHHLFMES